ncbi:energy transducer TonB [Polaribacter staleyi]|uniref:energy transducer TonB n=1 Tax=Polaribacter staleyi TaxID=2022337 RepID=UPI0031B9FEC8
MQILDTTYKRKSAVITAVILLLLIFGIFNYGMHYLDPPEEYGVAINFGTSEVGSGKPVEDTKKISAPKEVEEQKVVEEEVVEEEVKETPKEIVKEDLITEETVKDVPVVEKVKEVKKELVKKVVEKKKEVKKVVKKEVKKEVPKEKPKPKPSKATQDALNNLLNGNASDGKPQGEGDDDKPGVKGKVDGDPSSSKYYGNTGSGSGGDYNLAGRKVMITSKVQPDCQEEGTVVVQIQVDKNGKVIFAKPGYKGSTNTASCLLKAAKEAALRTKWNPDEKAPANQVGTIIYKFSLSK